MNLKLGVPVLMILVTMTAIGSASTTRYNCKYNNGAIEPLVVNVEDRVAHYGVKSAKWSITGLTSEFISMVTLRDVGGTLAVLDLNSGKLLMASVSNLCTGSISDCISGVEKSKLTSQELDSSICTKQ